MSAYLKCDVYRLSATVERQGLDRLAAQRRSPPRTPASSTAVASTPARPPGGGRLAKVTLTATSESDPTKTATATCPVIGL